MFFSQELFLNSWHNLKKEIDMKRFFIFAVVVGGLAFTACKKDYTCSCDATALGITVSYDTVFQDMKKADAESACTGLNFDAGALGSQTCTLD